MFNDWKPLILSFWFWPFLTLQPHLCLDSSYWKRFRVFVCGGGGCSFLWCFLCFRDGRVSLICVFIYGFSNWIKQFLKKCLSPWKRQQRWSKLERQWCSRQFSLDGSKCDLDFGQAIRLYFTGSGRAGHRRRVSHGLCN